MDADRDPIGGREAAGPSLEERARDRAAGLYQSGWWCGEAVLKAVSEAAGDPLPPEVVRLASGFCEGFGGSRCTCGALAGAVMAVGLLSGRESPRDPWEPSYDAAGELRRRFVTDQDASTCDEIATRHGGMRHPQRWAHCAELCGSCAAWVVGMAREKGWL